MVQIVFPDARMVEAFEKIERAGFTPRLPQQFQLKVGRFNYFWSTGTITVDSGPRVTGKGIEAFIALLEGGAPNAADERHPPVAIPPSTLGNTSSNRPSYDPDEVPF